MPRRCYEPGPVILLHQMRLGQQAEAGCAQVRLEEAEEAARQSAALFVRAKSWWQRFVTGGPGFARRTVPLMTPGDDGRHRHVACYLRVLAPSLTVPSPAHALRLCALLSDRPDALPVSGAAPAWACPEAVLSSGQASPRERAALLCGLLLGLGMDARLACGDGVRGEAFWVVTVAPGARTPSFWDPCSGTRFPPALVRCPGGTPFRSVSAVVGPDMLWGCVQTRAAAPDPMDPEAELVEAEVLGTLPHVHDLSWDFGDPSSWLPFPADAEKASPHQDQTHGGPHAPGECVECSG